MAEKAIKNNTKNHTKNQKVGHFAFIMASGTFLSRVLGYLRDMALAAVFDVQSKDALLLAMRLPNLFRRLLGEGSLSMAFIPVFQGFLEKNDKESAKKMVSALFSILVLFLTLVVALGIIYMEEIITVWASGDGFVNVPGKLEQSVQMARWMFGFLFFVCCYAFFMAILNTLGKFALGAVAPALFNLILIGAFLLPTSLLGLLGGSAISLDEHLHIVALAVLFGGAMQALLLLPQLWRSGYFPRLNFRWSRWKHTPGLSVFFISLAGGLVGTGVHQLTTIINTYFATRGEGYVSWLYFGDRLLELPLSLVSVSLGVALLPTLSGFWNRQDTTGFSKTLNRFLRFNYFTTLPCAAGLYFLAQPIIEVLFFRGKFTLTDVMAVSSIVEVYALTLIAASGVRILVPAFYAIKKPFLPASVGAGCLIVHVMVTPYLMNLLGVVGLALSTAFTTALNLVCLLILFRTRIGKIDSLEFIKSFFKFCISTALMIVVIHTYDWWLEVFSFDTRSLSQALSLLVTILLSALSYFTVSYFLRCQECVAVLNLISTKLKS